MGKQVIGPEEYKRLQQLGNVVDKPSDVGSRPDAGVASDIGFEPFNEHDTGLVIGMDQHANRAANQSYGEKIANNWINRIPNIFLSTVENIGYIADIEDYINIDNEVGNWLSNWANQAKIDLAESLGTTNYYDVNQALDIGNPDWWIQSGDNLINSAAGFVATGAIGGVGINALRKGANSIKWLESLGNVEAGFGSLGRLSQAGLNATMLNTAEGVGSAVNVYNEVYEQKLSEYLQETGEQEKASELAKQDAANAASRTINLNRANILLNITSAGALLKPSGIRQLMTSKNTLRKSLGEAFQEAGEETINLVAEKYGKTGDLYQAISETSAREFAEAALLGAIGGAGQTMLTGTFNKISGRELKNNELYYKQQEVLQQIKPQIDAIDQIIKSVNESGISPNETTTEKAKSNALSAQLYNAFENDLGSIVRNQYQEIINSDPESISSKYDTRENVDGLPNPNYYKTKAQQVLDIMDDIEKSYHWIKNNNRITDKQSGFNALVEAKVMTNLYRSKQSQIEKLEADVKSFIRNNNYANNIFDGGKISNYSKWQSSFVNKKFANEKIYHDLSKTISSLPAYQQLQREKQALNNIEDAINKAFNDWKDVLEGKTISKQVDSKEQTKSEKSLDQIIDEEAQKEFSVNEIEQIDDDQTNVPNPSQSEISEPELTEQELIYNKHNNWIDSVQSSINQGSLTESGVDKLIKAIEDGDISSLNVNTKKRYKRLSKTLKGLKKSFQKKSSSHDPMFTHTDRLIEVQSLNNNVFAKVTPEDKLSGDNFEIKVEKNQYHDTGDDPHLWHWEGTHKDLKFVRYPEVYAIYYKEEKLGVFINPNRIAHNNEIINSIDQLKDISLLSKINSSYVSNGKITESGNEFIQNYIDSQEVLKRLNANTFDFQILSLVVNRNLVDKKDRKRVNQHNDLIYTSKVDPSVSGVITYAVDKPSNEIRDIRIDGSGYFSNEVWKEIKNIIETVDNSGINNQLNNSYRAVYQTKDGKLGISGLDFPIGTEEEISKRRQMFLGFSVYINNDKTVFGQPADLFDKDLTPENIKAYFDSIKVPQYYGYFNELFQKYPEALKKKWSEYSSDEVNLFNRGINNMFFLSTGSDKNESVWQGSRYTITLEFKPASHSKFKSGQKLSAILFKIPTEKEIGHRANIDINDHHLFNNDGLVKKEVFGSNQIFQEQIPNIINSILRKQTSDSQLKQDLPGTDEHKILNIKPKVDVMDMEVVFQPEHIVTLRPKKGKVNINKTNQVKSEDQTENITPFSTSNIIESTIDPGAEVDFSGAFYQTLNHRDLISREQAKENLIKILPDNVLSDENLDTLINNIETDGIPYGAFIDKVIYLGNNVPKGTEYHEAFHAVFRMFLTDREIDRVINIAKKRYNEPTNKSLTSLRKIYKTLTDKEITDIYYEEKLAESFRKYSSSGIVRFPKLIRDLFDRILRFFRFISQVDLEQRILFSNIYSGAYRNAERKNNRFVGDQNPMFTILKGGIITYADSSQRINVLSVGQSNRIINSIAHHVYDYRKHNPEMSFDEAFELALEDERDQNTPDNFEYELNQIADPNTRTLISETIRNVGAVLDEKAKTNGRLNKDIIKEHVQDLLKIFTTEFDPDGENEDGNAETSMELIKKPLTEIGGINSLSQEMRQFMALTRMEMDEFGFDKVGVIRDLNDPMEADRFMRPINPHKVYDILTRALVDTPREEMFNKLYAIAQDNTEVNAFFKNLVAHIRQDDNHELGSSEWTPEHGTQEFKGNQYYNMFISSFNKIRSNQYFVTVDKNGGTRVFLANRMDIDQIQVDKWNVNYKNNKSNNNLKPHISVLSDYLLSSDVYTPSQINRVVEELYEAFRGIGVDLSRAYVKWSVLDRQRDELESSEFKDLYLFYKSFGYVDSFYDQLIDVKGKRISLPIEILFNRGQNIITEANTRWKTIALSNGLFDETVGSSTMRNVEGKMVYEVLNPSYATEEILKYATDNRRREFVDLYHDGNETEALEMFKLAFDINDNNEAKVLYDYIKDNPLLNHSRRNQIFNRNLRINFPQGMKVVVGEDDKSNTKKAKSFHKLSPSDILLNLISLYTDEKDGSVLYNVSVNSTARSHNIVRLPKEIMYNKDGVTQKAIDYMFDMFHQEYKRIGRAYNSPIDVQDYNNGKNRGKEFSDQFKYLSNVNNLDVLKLARNNSELNSDEILTIKNEIQIQLGKDTDDFIEFLKSDEIALFDDKKTTLPKYFRDDKNIINEERIKNYYLNDTIMTMAFDQLLSFDDALNYKNPIDKVKRIKGATTGAGVVLDQGKYIIKVDETVKEVVGEYAGDDGQGIDRTDAQSMTSPYWFLDFYATSLAKKTKRVENIIKSIIKDEKISKSDNKYLKNLKAQLLPLKTIHYDQINNVKTSVNIITREESSIRNPKISKKEFDKRYDEFFNLIDQFREGKVSRESISSYWFSNIEELWLPLPHRRKMFDKLNEMESKQYDFFSYDSAIKRAKRFGKFEVNGKHTKLQLETQGVKTEITDGIQKMQLIYSEQDNDLEVEIKSPIIKGISTIGELVNGYLSLLGKRVQIGLDKKNQKLFNNNGTLNEIHLSSVIRDGLLASGADSFTLTLLSGNDQGFEFNPNLPVIQSKFEPMYLSHLNKGSLRQKRAGFKGSLVSDNEYEILRDNNNNVVRTDQIKANPAEYYDLSTGNLKEGYRVDRLKFAQKNGDIYESEVIIPKFLAEMNQIEIGDNIPSHLSEMLGVRIPTQDKHSMVNIKVVDFVPEYKGNMIVLPAEIVALAGSDFDIDALYVSRYDYYDNGIYGEYLTSKTPNNTAYNEYLSTIDETEEEYTFDDFDEEYAEQLEYNIEQYEKGRYHMINPLTIQEANNLLLSIERVLMHNEGNDKIARTPATMTVIEDQISELERKGIKVESDIKGTSSPKDKIQHYRNGFAGQQNIGPMALTNTAFQYRHKFGLKLSDNGNYEVLFGKYDKFGRSTKDGILNEDDQRINDIISAFVSSATDNEKHHHAAKLGLTVDALGAIAHMIEIGVPVKTAINVLNSPIVKELVSKLSGVQNIISKEKKVPRSIELWEEYKEKYQNDNFYTEDDIDTIVGLTMNDLKMNEMYAEISAYALRQFSLAYDRAQFNRNFNTIISSAKGDYSTFAQLEVVEKALEKLGLEFRNNKVHLVNGNVPYDYSKIINESKFILSNIKTVFNILENSRQTFILQDPDLRSMMRTEIFNHLSEVLQDNEDVINEIRRFFLAYIQNKLYNSKSNKNDSISEINNGIIVESLEAMQSDSALSQNYLIRRLIADKTKNIITMDTFAQISKDDNDKLQKAFEDLMIMGGEYQKFAIDLFHHARMKDLLMFRNGSLVKGFSPIVFKKISDYMTEFHQVLLNDENTNELTGLFKDEMVNEFADLYFRHIQNQNSLPVMGQFGNLARDNKFIIRKQGNELSVNAFDDNSFKALTSNNMPFTKNPIDGSLFSPKYFTRWEGDFETSRKVLYQRTAYGNFSATYKEIDFIGNYDMLPYNFTIEQWEKLNSSNTRNRLNYWEQQKILLQNEMIETIPQDKINEAIAIIEMTEINSNEELGALKRKICEL